MAKRPSGRPDDGERVFKSIADSLRERIEANEIPRNKRMPSQRKLAKAFNVSKRTIERALEILCEEGYCRRRSRGQLVAAIGDSGINLERHLVLEVLSDPLINLMKGKVFNQFQRGIEQGLAEQYAPLMMVHDGYLRGHLPPRLIDQGARGAILYGRFQLKILERYARLPMPVVLCDLPARGHSLGSLTVDNEVAAFDATRRLIQLGHRRIAFQRGIQLNLRDVDWDAKERQRGYEAALTEANIKPRSAFIFNSIFGESQPAKWVKHLLNVTPPLTALIANNPQEAEAVRLHAESLGRRVPRDFSIVCFQRVRPVFPHLTGPRIDFHHMGRRAVEKIFDPETASSQERISTVWREGRTLGPAG